MAINPNYNPINIQLYLFKLFDNKVSNQTYLTNVPKFLTEAEKDEDFMVISLPAPLLNRNAFGTMSVVIEVFVQSQVNARQDSEVLMNMYDKLMKVVDEENDRKEVDEENKRVYKKYILRHNPESAWLEYDEKMGYQKLITVFTILIK